MRTFNLTCEAVEATLPDYLDETLEPWVRTSIEEHLGECARCTALAHELRNIVREAAALPALLPEREVWPGIAGRIGASVIDSKPLAERTPVAPTINEAVAPTINEPVAPTMSEPVSPTISEPVAPTISAPETPIVVPIVLAADASPSISEAADFPMELPASASEWPVLTTEPPPIYSELSRSTRAPLALVSEPVAPPGAAPVPTIGPTHGLPPGREKFWRPEWMALAATALVLVSVGTTFLLTEHWLGPARPSNVASDTRTPTGSPSERLPRERGVRGPAASTATPSSGQLGSALTVAATPVTPSPEQVVYTREINTLQRIVRRQNAELDASTVAEIDKNLRTLDSAIGQIRAALRKDPGSSLLDGQASRALEMKVELLRRAAMLRSST